MKEEEEDAPATSGRLLAFNI